MDCPQSHTQSLQEQLVLLTLSDATMGQQLVKPCGFIRALGILQKHQTQFPLLSSWPPVYPQVVADHETKRSVLPLETFTQEPTDWNKLKSQFHS